MVPSANPSTCAVSIGRRFSTAAVVVVVLAVAIGCGSEASSPTSQPVLRFIEAPPQEIFEIGDIAEEIEVFDLSPDRRAKNGGWSVEAAEVKGWKNGFLRLEKVGDGATFLDHRLEDGGAGVDVIELEIGGLRPSSSIRLLWANDGKDFNNGRSIRFGARRGEGTMFRTFRFDVGNHDLWSDSATRIRLEVEGDERIVFLGRLVGLRLEVGDDRLRTAAAGPWLADLDGRHRGVLLAVSGSPVERRLRLPANAELRFGIGVPPTIPDPIAFRVSVAGDAEAGAPVTIFEERVDGAEGVGWHDRVVDLSAFAGREVGLSLEIDIGGVPDPVNGLPMWADPVVVAPSSKQPRANVVLISLDTLRADRMSLYGYDRLTTRRLDRWADRRAVVFETVVAPSPWTLPSHVSIMTGVDALAHGVNHPAPAPTTLLTLAEMLRSKGYATVAVTGGSYLHPRFGLAQGFDDYRSFQGELDLELETGVEAALGWLDDHARRAPFFLFFHTYEVHDPYDPREPYYSGFAGAPFDPSLRDAVTRNAGDVRPDRLRNVNQFVIRDSAGNRESPVAWDEVGVVSDLYDSGVAYADELVGRLLDRLSQPDLRDNTMVIVTSDHGEALGEHRLAGHTSLYDHDLLVPLVVLLPGGEGHGARVSEQVRSVDIPATVLDAVGLPPPPGLDGRSLLPLITGEERGPRVAQSYAALSNHGLGLRTGDNVKYIFRNLPWEIPAGWEELFDLDADPGETRNLAPDFGDLERLRALAVDSFDNRQSGLRLVMANTGKRPCKVELGGNGITVNSSTIKTTQRGGGCRVSDLGRMLCELPVGGEMTLVGERIEDPRVELFGNVAWKGIEPETPFTLGFEVGVDHEPRSLVVVAEAGDPDTRRVSLTASWTGDPGILGLDPAETDSELRRQLEALGYIH